MNRCILVAVALICAGNVCPAQPPADTNNLPAEPWVLVNAPDFAKWTIDYKYTDAAVRTRARAEMAQSMAETAKADPGYAKMVAGNPSMQVALNPPLLLQVAITKTRNLKQEKLAYEGGLVGERWSDGIAKMSLLPGSNIISVDPVSNGVATNDFREFNWIARDKFQGHKQVGSGDYLIFQESAPALQITDQRLYNNLRVSNASSDRVKIVVPIIAVIDATTKLPVSLQLGSEIHLYTFLPADTDMLVIPEAFAQAAKQREAAFRQMSNTRPPP